MADFSGKPPYPTGSESFTRDLYLALGLSERTAERAIRYSRQIPGEPPELEGKPSRGRPRARTIWRDAPSPGFSVPRRKPA
jgi:hypothetical protein